MLEIALSLDFFQSSASRNLPLKVRGLIRKVVKKISHADSISHLLSDNGLNFELLKTQRSRKTKVFSVRVDSDYRIIIFQGSDNGPLHFVHINKHDEAYKWALRKDLVIHPKTGSLQLLPVQDISEPVVEINSPLNFNSEISEEGKLSYIRDIHWQRIGLPPHLVVQVKSFSTPEQANFIKDQVNDETYEAIFFLLSGYSLEEVLTSIKCNVVKRFKPIPLFDGVSEEDLLELSVPQVFVPNVYTIYEEKDLDQSQSYLPIESYEGLFFLNCGFSVDEVLQEYGRLRGRIIDTTDYKTALDISDSQRNHILLTSTEELDNLLSDSMQTWRIFLHPSQRKLVESEQSGPCLILGGAGTGKTVVAMHRAKWLAEKVCLPEERIFFTTFNVNLAQDIDKNLDSLCGAEIKKRIHVCSIDKWVWEFLKANNYDCEIEYFGNKESVNLNNCWHKAKNQVSYVQSIDNDTLVWEWENIFEPFEFSNIEKYMRFRSSIERVVPLSERSIGVVFEFFMTFSRLLDQRNITTFGRALKKAALIAESLGPQFRSVVVDEAQDMRPGAWMFLKKIVPDQGNSIFIVGDPAQRIGSGYSIISQCGLDVSSRVHKLYLNYRTTEAIRVWACQLLEKKFIDNLDGGFDSQRGYHSERKGEPPDISGFDSFSNEARFIKDKIDYLTKGNVNLKDIVIVTRNTQLFFRYKSALEALSVPIFELKKQEIDDRSQEGVRMTIMHRVKGLEFEHVLIAGMSDENLPLKWIWEKKTGLDRENFENMERALLYVSATRAKESLTITWNGRRSFLID